MKPPDALLDRIRKGIAEGLVERAHGRPVLPEQTHRPENMPMLARAKRRRRAKNKVAKATRKAAR